MNSTDKDNALRLSLQFHPLEDGRIMCRRFDPEGNEYPSLFYSREAYKPFGLLPEEEEEWDTAVTLIKELQP